MEVFIHGIGRTATDNCGYEQIDFQKKKNTQRIILDMVYKGIYILIN